MGDKLDSTIDSVISNNKKVDYPSSEGRKHAEKPGNRVRKESDSSRKRKFEETQFPDRPDTLETFKRTKKDDELLINVSEEIRPSTSTSKPPEPPSPRKKLSSSVVSQDTEGDEEPEDEEQSSSEKTSHREPSITETDPMKIWTASDDMALITAVSHVSCLKFIYNSLPFSRKFSYSDLEERFCQLMYDEQMSKVAKKRMAEMSHRQRLQIESRTPFSRVEEKCLMESAETVLKTTRGDKAESETHTSLKIEHFKKILDTNRPSFHKSRTPQVLSDHFRRIKMYREQSGASEKYNWAALEQPADGLNMDFDMHVPLQACRARYYAIIRRPVLRPILKHFQTNATVPDNAIAIIHGQFLQYAMTGRLVVMGRSSLTDKVDIDLSKEGPAAKVSRQQALICHVGDGEFTIQNIGQRPMYVDSKPLPQMVSTSLKHGSIIEIASLRLIFSIPVPRNLHPLTRQCAVQHRKLQYEQQLQLQQQQQQQHHHNNYQRSSGGPAPYRSPTGSTAPPQPLKKSRLAKPSQPLIGGNSQMMMMQQKVVARRPEWDKEPPF